MCGICGVICADATAVEPAVRKMMRAMVHRGPDDEGFESLPLGRGEADPATAGFGFRRLSILDLSPAGHQPMFDEKTGNCLVFNGEIYNFWQLRDELRQHGVVFRSSGDTEVLLQALSFWGERAVEKLQGMYAFAFYDAASRRILLGRDPLGIKPLYHASLPGGFLFASEIRPLLDSGFIPPDLDLAGIAGMLAYGATQAPRTVYEHIRVFPAGHVQWIDGEVVAQTPPAAPRPYWTFPPRVRPCAREEAVATVRRLIHESVLRHLAADVPVGVCLSAGIDSTVIASFARDYTSSVTAFTVGFGSVHGEDEVLGAAATAKALGLRHVSVELDAGNMPAKWREWLDHMDSPSIDGFNTYVVSRRLAQEGVVVGLSGLGADELFGGYSSFRRVPRWSRLLSAMRFVPPGMRGSLATALTALGYPEGVTEKVFDLLTGGPHVAAVTRSLRRVLSNRHLRALGLEPERVGLADDYLERGRGRVDPVFDGDTFNTVARVEAVNYMGDTLLRDTDFNSMRHSLELRVPFLDLPLLEYVSGLTGDVKRGGTSKDLLRRAARESLGTRVANRPKTGFTLPIGDWMRGAMREPCEAAVQSLATKSFVDAAEVRRVWRSFCDDPRSMHWSRPFALVVLGNHLA